jgi:hypothetical protein
VPEGSPFVVLSDALVQSGMPLSGRGLPQRFRYGPLARASTDPSYAEATIVPDAVGLRPLRPVHARLVRREGGDLVLTWIRRTRQGGDPWEQAEVPLAEEREAYEVDILDGAGAVLRTLAVAAPAATYAAADQAVDLGCPVLSLSVAIHQLSAAYGRGAPLRTVLHV